MRVDSRKPTESLGDGIYKEYREDGSFVIKAKWKHPVTGKWMGPHVAPGAQTKTEGKAWRIEHVFAIKSKKLFDEDAGVAAMANAWLDIRKDALEDGLLAPKTYHADEHAAKTIKAWFKSKTEIETEDVRNFNRAMKSGKGSLSGKPLAPKTRDSILNILSQMFARKIAENRGGFNPVLGLASTERSQRREREPIEMSPKAIKDLLYWATKRTPKFRLLFLVLSVTGMRIEEALKLRWENLIVGDDGQDYLQITNGKQKRASGFKVKRLVPVGRELKAELAAARLAAPKWASGSDEYVFATSAGKHTSYRNVRRALRTVSEEMGYGPTAEEHLHCHDFRHSLCVNVRSSLRTYGERLAFCRSLGWKDTTMYDRVYGQSRDAIEEMASTAADVLARAGVGV